MKTIVTAINEILQLSPLEFGAHWKQIDQIVASLKTPGDQIAADARHKFFRAQR